MQVPTPATDHAEETSNPTAAGWVEAEEADPAEDVDSVRLGRKGMGREGAGGGGAPLPSAAVLLQPQGGSSLPVSAIVAVLLE